METFELGSSRMEQRFKKSIERLVIELNPSEEIWATPAEIDHQMRQDEKAYQEVESLPEWLIPNIAVDPLR